jgi:HAD superfamily hydrolase (TIGR01484 family)
MQELAAFTQREALGLEGLLFDLDDTVLDHGSLSVRAYEALARARAAGLALVAVTGRPLGWGEVIARMWPVDGVVSENGAVASRFVDGRLVRHDRASEAQRGGRRAALERIWQAVREAHPGAALSDDSAWRLTDVAIDVAEGRREPAERVAAMARMGRELGARVTVSSVHLHLSLEGDDKASGVIRFLMETRGVDVTAARHRFAFVGDSGNDAACFAAFSSTFGVANVAAHARRMTVPPRYVARGERGAGFVEIVDALIERRRSGG